MITPVPWGAVVGGVRVQLSTGRVVHVLDRIPGRPDLVLMRNGSGETRLATVDPAAPAAVIVAELEAALVVLRQHFGHVEYLREDR